LTSFLFGLAVATVLSPFLGLALWLAKRQRGGAVLVAGLLLAFGMNVQIIPPPPPAVEAVQRVAQDDENDGE
jgi:hypothetical protein